MEAGPQSPGKAPIFSSEPPPSTPPLRSFYNYVGLKAWQGPGILRQARRAGTEKLEGSGGS